MKLVSVKCYVLVYEVLLLMFLLEVIERQYKLKKKKEVIRGAHIYIENLDLNL